MKTFKDYLEENKKTMTLWHGGDLRNGLSDSITHKRGKWEYGPGLYLTTNYETAQKYSKGRRKLYKIIVEHGNNINDVNLDINEVNEFIQQNVINRKKSIVNERIYKYTKNNTINADIFLNIIINNDAIQLRNSNNLRAFLVNNNIDYSLVSNAFGWHEMMLVLFNMKKILDVSVINPKDKIDIFDLPTEFS